MTQEQVKTLSDALAHAFDAEVEAEQVDPRGRYRFAVVSPRFENVERMDRQDAIWAVVDRVMPKNTMLDISLILAFDPKDLETAASR